jgi:acyl carrier protein
MMNELEREIIDTIAEESGLDRDDIKPDLDLYSLGIDSLSALEILVALEEKYDIIIQEDDLRNVNNIREIVNIVLGKLPREREGTLPRHSAKAVNAAAAKALSR